MPPLPLVYDHFWSFHEDRQEDEIYVFDDKYGKEVREIDANMQYQYWHKYHVMPLLERSIPPECTDTELARMLGVHRSTVHKYRSGEVLPSRECLHRWLKIFNLKYPPHGTDGIIEAIANGRASDTVQYRIETAVMVTTHERIRHDKPDTSILDMACRHTLILPGDIHQRWLDLLRTYESDLNLALDDRRIFSFLADFLSSAGEIFGTLGKSKEFADSSNYLARIDLENQADIDLLLEAIARSWNQHALITHKVVRCLSPV